MKVLLINTIINSGSTGRICTNIYNELVKNGHECCIAYSRGSASSNMFSYKIGNKFSIYFNALKARIFDNEGFNAKYTTYKLVKFIKQYNPDVIHLHNLHGYYLNISILFKYLATSNAKIYWTLHDSWAFTGRCALFNCNNCYKWQSSCDKCSYKHTYPKTLFFSNSKKNLSKKKELYKNVDMTIITPSKWLKNMVSNSILSDKKCVVINNGININHFYSKGTCDFSKKIILGVSNVWTVEKGLNVFLDLSKIIPEGYIIKMVGCNDKLINKLKGYDKIIPLKRTNSIRELAALYREAYVFCNPTYDDNFPTTNIESLCSGTPVITFNTGGSPEMINENNGIITPNKDAVSINDCLNEIENLYNVFSFDRAKYDYKNMINDILKLYGEFNYDEKYD